MPNDLESANLLSAAALADLRGVHVRTIHRMVKRGELIPFVKAPGSRGAYLFRCADGEDVTAERAAS